MNFYAVGVGLRGLIENETFSNISEQIVSDPILADFAEKVGEMAAPILKDLASTSAGKAFLSGAVKEVFTKITSLSMGLMADHKIKLIALGSTAFVVKALEKRSSNTFE